MKLKEIEKAIELVNNGEIAEMHNEIFKKEKRYLYE